MKRMASKKSHSWWWNSHISPKNSKWLAENLEVMDCRVKEMLKLIEEEGDSFAKKAEMYYQKRPELISHVEDFYRMYRALAERYDHVTGELRKTIPSELRSQGSSGGSDVGSEPPSPSQYPSPEHTPDHKLSRPKPSPRAAGFDFFLGSGGSSDPSRRGSDRSSSSDSESESDDSKNDDGDSDGLHRRIIELESELRDVKEKLHEHEEKCSRSPSEGMENGEHECLESKVTELEKELVDANEKFWVSEQEIARLEQELERNVQTFHELRLYKDQTAELQERIVSLDSDISGREHELKDLKTKHSAIVRQLEDDVSIREEVIAEFRMEVANLHEKSVQEKLQLEAVITDREREIEELKIAIESVSKEKSLLFARVTEQEHVIEGLREEVSDSMDKFSKEKLKLEEELGGLSVSHAALKIELEKLETGNRQLEAEKADLCTTGSRRVEELNHDLDDLKLQLDMLMAERNELSARVNALTEDVKSRDSRLSLMEGHLQHLHLEHVGLISETKAAQIASKELRERVKELEEEVERQRAVISDAAEGKREAIRQLCFSLEHYRDGYCRLRQVLQGTSKRPPTAVLAS